MKIKSIKAIKVLNSRGDFTLEVIVSTDKCQGRTLVPSGASTGKYEAVELKDLDKAIQNIKKIEKKLKGVNVTEQKKIDKIMIELDGTPNKSKLGANAILGVSLAVARCAAKEKKISLYQYLGSGRSFPIPYANVINGGKHAGNKLPVQEFMIVPYKAKSFLEATEMVSRTYHILKELIKKEYGFSAINVGDEGGFAPPITKTEDALDLLVKAIGDAGYKSKMKIALDVAASELFSNNKYKLHKVFDKGELIKYYLKLIKKYPIISIEDPFDQDDFLPWFLLKQKTKIQIVGDDLLVSNIERIQMATDKKLCNCLLLKVNQIGTLTEAMNAVKLAKKNKWSIMVSHRSGETEDSFIADLAVAINCKQIKLGAPARGERTAKYNRLLEIENNLNSKV